MLSWAGINKTPTVKGFRTDEKMTLVQASNRREAEKHKHIIMDYNAVVANPEAELTRLAEFLPLPLCVPDAVLAIDQTLYINRGEGI
jgi:hypothetical protein